MANIPNWTNAQVIAQLDSGDHWSGSNFTYAFPTSAAPTHSGRNEGDTFRPLNADQQALVRIAIMTWDDLIPQSFAQVAEGNSYDDANVEYGLATTGVSYAHAFFPPVGSVWFNPTVGMDAFPIGTYDFATVVHETGHALGLNHMGNYNGAGSWTPSSYQDSVVLSIMSYFGPGGNTPSPDVADADWIHPDAPEETFNPQTPMVNDILAIQSMYGTSATTRTGDTVYGFSSNLTGDAAAIHDFTLNRFPILTIFDSGGTDTLNLGGWSTPSQITLVAGGYSSANHMTNNIAIALSTTIENAVGGSGSDTIAGNAVANVLLGGAGNDQLAGAAGDDVLSGGAGNDQVDGGDGSDTALLDAPWASFSISFANGTYSLVHGTWGSDTYASVEYFQFSDQLRSAASLSSSDTTGPQLTSATPADGATGVSAATNLALTFDEEVVAGSGNLTIHDANGAVVRTIAVTDTTQVAFSGTTMTVNPSSDLSTGTAYYLNLAAGAVRDRAGNAFAGIANATTLNFTTGATNLVDDYPFSTDTPGVVLVNGGPATGSIETVDDTDLLRVSLTAGSTYVFELDGTNGGLPDPYLRLFGPDTQQIVADDDSGDGLNARIEYTATVSGMYFLGALDVGTGTGAYTLTASTTSDDFPWSTDTTGTITVNGAAALGVVNSPDDYDLFKVALTAGTTYTIALTRTTGGLADPFLLLYSPNVVQVAYDDDSGGGLNARLTYTATTSGTYYVGATNADGSTGGYGVSVSVADTTAPLLVGATPADNATGVSPSANLVLQFNEAVQAGTGNILVYNANGTVARSISVTDTSQVTFAGTNVTVNPASDLGYATSYYLAIGNGVLRDAAGNAYAGITGTGTLNFTTAALTATDDFPLSEQTTGVVTVGGNGTGGRIDYVDDGDVFKVSLVAGESYVFEMQAIDATLDPLLQLYSPAIEPLAKDDDSGDGIDSLITFTALETGVHYLVGWDYGSGAGRYTMSAWQPQDDYAWSTETDGVVAVDGVASVGTIETSGDADLFGVSLAAGTTYLFSLARTGGGLDDPYLILYDAQVEQVDYDDDGGGLLNSELEFTPSASGTYWLGAMDFGSGTGGYALAARRAGATGTILGTSGNDVVLGTTGDNQLDGKAGDDQIAGGEGSDTAILSGAFSGYRIEKEAGGWRVVDEVASNGNDGTDWLTGIESLKFADATFALENLPWATTPMFVNLDTDWLFDGVWYLLDNPELVPTVTLANAAQHYLGVGAAQGRTPTSWFDATWYENRWADLKPLGWSDADLFMHFNMYGIWEGRAAGPTFANFDGERYLADWPDVAGYVDAFIDNFLGSRTNGAIWHYTVYGYDEQRVAYDTSGAAVDLGYTI